MASLPTGSDKLLEIRTAYIDFSVKSKGRVAYRYPKRDSGASSLRVVGTDLEQINIPVESISEKYSDHTGIAFHEITLPPLFFEQTDYAITVRSRGGQTLTFVNGKP